ncbi:MAG: RNA polymerase sigma-54 factor, partial [Flavobacteriales bacterium CG03_land_8_20_14_0_80_35_15]
MLNQRLQQKLMQKLSPQQIQLMRLIQLPTQAFEQKLKQEIEENPALESGKEDDISDDAFSNDYDNDDYESFDSDADSSSDLNIDEYLSDDEIPNYRLQANNYSSDDEEKSIPFASEKSFTQYLQEQLNTFSLSEKDAQIAEFLVGSIDDSGYLRRSVEDIVDDLAFSQNISTKVAEVNKILNLVQQLDPVGVGARDLKECLLLQLKRKTETPARLLAITLLSESFDEFVKKHFDKLIFIHQISEDALRNAIKEIACLNPKPGGNFIDNSKSNSQIIPDFTITIEDNELVLQLHG